MAAAPMPAPVGALPLKVTELWKAYGGVEALRGVDLDVAGGEILALVGANGAGKSTLLSLAAGLLRPDRGVVRVVGKEPYRRPAIGRTLLGLVPQELAVYPPITVRENLVFFADLASIRGSTRTNRIAETAGALGLESLLDRAVRTISGGERRRLHIAIALLHRPPLLLLDEATAGLDLSGRASLLEVVRELANQGTAILYSTNRLDEAEELGGSVAILDRGEIVESGSVHGLLAAHGEATVEVAYRGLGAVFLAVTGRRYEPAGSIGTGDDDAPR